MKFEIHDIAKTARKSRRELRAVVVVLLLLGAYHWKNVVVPDWPSRSSARFRTSAALEIVACAIVLALTAVLLMTGLPQP